MDISDRIESRDPLAIAGYLVFAFEEWIAELIRQACDGDSPETRDAVIKAVHFHDAFATRSLTPAQLAELAEGAAGWMEPKWPSDPADADEVERLLGISRELLELRDRALAAGRHARGPRSARRCRTARARRPQALRGRRVAHDEPWRGRVRRGPGVEVLERVVCRASPREGRR
jgi:hypothetical protein